ncbi:CO9 protein, partial [Crypturellus soui]|nr:CO9 protein [Crypturellus soui]
SFFNYLYNLFIIFSKTKADKTFTAEYYHDRTEMIREVYIENERKFNADLSVKYTPTDASGKETAQENFKYHYSKNSSLSSVLKTVTERVILIIQTGHSHLLPSSPWCVQNQTFLRVKGKIQLGRFQMRSRDVRLTDTFLDDLNFLPAKYDKGEYFKFLEDYGTHYAVSGAVGGKYELVYVLDDYAMSHSGITVEDVKKCLGYHLDASAAYKGLNADLNINDNKCQKIKVRDKCKYILTFCLKKDNTVIPSQYKDDAVIDDVISLVDGGKIDFSVKIKEMLLRGVKTVNIEDYIEWAKSLVDAPVVIQQRPSPIYTLVPVKMRDAYVKKQNLERAIEDYITEYSTCKCKPCENGGTVVLVDGACTCMCSNYFKGIACQIPKST